MFPNTEKINLNIVYPKPEKTELRMYLSARAGFKPEGGEIWFVFIKDKILWIGSMPERQWRNESSEFKQDEFDNIYQESVNESDVIQIAKLKERDGYIRNRNIALERFRAFGILL